MIKPTPLALGFLGVIFLLLGALVAAPWFTQRPDLQRSVTSGAWATEASFRGHDAAVACTHRLAERRLAVEGAPALDAAGAQMFRCTPP